MSRKPSSDALWFTRFNKADPRGFRKWPAVTYCRSSPRSFRPSGVGCTFDAMTAHRLVYTGSYTSDTGGEGPGLDTLWLDPSTGLLTTATGLPAVAISGPSFLAAHPGGRVVYSTHEREDGAVSA